MSSSCLRGRWTRSRLQGTAHPPCSQRPRRPGERLHHWAWTISPYPLPLPGVGPEPMPTVLCSGKDTHHHIHDKLNLKKPFECLFVCISFQNKTIFFCPTQNTFILISVLLLVSWWRPIAHNFIIIMI